MPLIGELWIICSRRQRKGKVVVSVTTAFPPRGIFPAFFYPVEIIKVSIFRDRLFYRGTFSESDLIPEVKTIGFMRCFIFPCVREYSFHAQRAVLFAHLVQFADSRTG